MKKFFVALKAAFSPELEPVRFAQLVRDVSAFMFAAGYSWFNDSNTAFLVALVGIAFDTVHTFQVRGKVTPVSQVTGQAVPPA